jgi:circadian clock protein KaiC
MDDDRPAAPRERPLAKTPTGIRGFDEISNGGLPEDRTTIVIGGPGAGKTVFAVQTVVNRLLTRGEPAIVVAFEEPIASIEQNMASFDWDIAELRRRGLTFVNAKTPTHALLGGAFDLNGLLTMLTALQQETGARTIVFDGLDMLLGTLSSEALERHELARLDEWVRQSGVSAILTVKLSGISERDQLHSDFIEYMTDCVVMLSSTSSETTASRSLRITKYRGSGYAANPVPMVIGGFGIDVLAFRNTRKDYPAFTDRVSSGVLALDAIIGGGYMRGSSILISGSPGTSKTSLSASFAAAACARDEKALFVSFDESGSQIVANMRSIGLDLSASLEKGSLIMASLLSTGRSPEEHYKAIRDLLERHRPHCLVIDPLSALLKSGYPFTEMISESLVETSKELGITVLCTSLLGQVSGETELSASRVSTVADTWIHVSYVAEAGERNRALTIIKSRGTHHSNQVRELLLSHAGVHLKDVYVAEGRVLMGSARAQKEAESLRLQTVALVGHEHVKRQLDHEIADLQTRSKMLAQDLVSKQREAAFHDLSERIRAEQETATAATRLALRVADDDPGRFANVVPSSAP